MKKIVKKIVKISWLIARWSLGVFFIFVFSFQELRIGNIASAICAAAIGIILIPPFFNFIISKVPSFRFKNVTIAIFIILLFVSLTTALTHDYDKYELEEQVEEQQRKKQEIKQEEYNNPSYNQVLNSARKRDGSQKVYIGKTIKWQAKISASYSQIDGIKFCVVDKDHQDVDIDKSCDWFWAWSKNLSGANDLELNPDWDGRWVPYTLNYYKVPFNKDERYYDEIYTIEGRISGIGCNEPYPEFPDYDCILDVDIINITKEIETVSGSIEEKTFNEEELKNYYAIYDDPFVIHVRKALNGYLDGTNIGMDLPDFVIQKGEIGGSTSGLASFDKDYYKSKFVVMYINNALGGGKEMQIIFQDKPDKVFMAWIYDLADGQYDLRGFWENTEATQNIDVTLKTFRKYIFDKEHSL